MLLTRSGLGTVGERGRRQRTHLSPSSLPQHVARRPGVHSILPARRERVHYPQAAAGGTAGGTGAGSSGGSSGGSGGGSSSSGDADDSQSPHPLQKWTYLYAAFLAAGGIFAYVKKGSGKSLVSAGGSALIVALSARKMVGAAARMNIVVAMFISGLVSVVMASRYSRTKKVMPAGLTAALSVAMTAALITSLV